ncbi:hypothetical protein ACLX1H_004631 [Fusarium chlamydosporum]
MLYGNSSASKNGTTFHFLPVTTTEPSTRREIELRQASARSHLARTIHRRKRSSARKNTRPSEMNLLGDRDTVCANHIGSLHCQRVTPELFCSIPDQVVGRHTRLLLHYCIQSFWPGFEVGTAAFHIPSFARDFNTLVAQGPALVHALLWSAAVSLSYRRKERVTDKESLMHYNQALNYISQDVTKPVTEIPEQTMYAILSLTGPEVSADNGECIVKRAFNPPLAELSWIHVYGRRLHIDAHAKALIRIVQLKGGIHNLKSPDFQASFNYMDLTRASQKLVRPHLHVSKMYGRVWKTHDRRQFFGYATDLASGCSVQVSMKAIDRLRESGLSTELEDIIYDMRTWVKVIEGYHCGLLTNPDSSLLTAHRDLIQQRLLATLTEEDENSLRGDISETQDDVGGWINDLVQTALLIFSLGVTFPIPYAPPYHRLAKRLQDQLEQYTERAFGLGLFDLLIWVGMLGVLCSEQVGDDLKTWFIHFLSTVEKAHTSGSETREWVVVKTESLETFLWSSVSCDATAKGAWKEVQEGEGSRGWEIIAWQGMLGTICG